MENYFAKKYGQQDQKDTENVFAKKYEKDNFFAKKYAKGQPEPEPERTVLGTAKDVGVSLVKGVVGTGEAVVGLADLASGGRAGKALEKIGYDPEGTHEILSDQYSPAQKAANEKVEQAEGFIDTTKAMLQNPSTIVQSVVESAPLMVGGQGIARLGMKALPKVFSGSTARQLAASAAGEGIISAGSSAESIRQQNEDGLLSPEQSAMAAASGFGTGALTLAGGRLAKKLGFADIDSMLAGIPQNAARKEGVGRITDVARKIAEGGISEGVFEEMPQSVQEQIWMNAALDKPLMEGVGEAAAAGMLTGAAMGSGANVVSSALPGRREQAEPPIQDVPPVVEPPVGEAIPESNVPEIPLPSQIKAQPAAVQPVIQPQPMGDDVPDFPMPQALKAQPQTTPATAPATVPTNKPIGKGVSVDQVRREHGPDVARAVHQARKSGKPISIEQALKIIENAPERRVTEKDSPAKIADAYGQAVADRISAAKKNGQQLTIQDAIAAVENRGNIRKQAEEDAKAFNLTPRQAGTLRRIREGGKVWAEGMKGDPGYKNVVDGLLKSGLVQRTDDGMLVAASVMEDSAGDQVASEQQAADVDVQEINQGGIDETIQQDQQAGAGMAQAGGSDTISQGVATTDQEGGSIGDQYREDGGSGRGIQSVSQEPPSEFPLTETEQQFLNFLRRDAEAGKPAIIPNERNRPVYDALVEKGLAQKQGDGYAYLGRDAGTGEAGAGQLPVSQAQAESQGGNQGRVGRLDEDAGRRISQGDKSQTVDDRNALEDGTTGRPADVRSAPMEPLSGREDRQGADREPVRRDGALELAEPQVVQQQEQPPTLPEDQRTTEKPVELIANGQRQKSTGHIAFTDEYEYYDVPGGDIHRAPIENPIGSNGRRSGRFEATQAAKPALLKMLGVEDISPDKEKADPPSAPDQGQSSGPGLVGEIVEHTTKRGKVLRGRIVKDITVQQAREMDAYAFRKDGGFFIREGSQVKIPPRKETEATAKADSEKTAVPKAKATNASKLRAASESLKAKGEQKLGQDRLANTARRARMAGNAEADARRDIEMANTMVNIAEAQESGEAEFLSGVSAKSHVDLLATLLNQAKYRAERAKTDGTTIDYKRPSDQRDAPFAEYPFPKFNDFSDLDALITALGNKKGWKAKRDELRRGGLTVTGEKRLALLREALNVIGDDYRLNRVTEDLKNHDRLKRIGINNRDDLEQALREFVKYSGSAPKVDRAKQLERALVGQNTGVDFFPTPKAQAREIVARAGIEPGMKVLEPSAGTGNLAEVMREEGAVVDVAELSPSHREVLEAKGFTVIENDFMDMTEGEYDAIVMNPPFSKNMDIQHVRHAYDLLKPGGKLVAIMGEGAFFRTGKTETEFREWLDQVGTSEKLPENFFMDRRELRTTGVNARVVEIVKEAEQVLDSPDTTTPTAGRKYETTLGAILAEVSNEQGITGQLAKLMQSFIPGSKLDAKVIVDPSVETSNYQAGKVNTITLQDPAKATTGLHEIVHAVTYREMESNPALKAEVRKLMDQVKKKAIKEAVVTPAEMAAIEKMKTSADFKAMFSRDKKYGDIAYAFLNEAEFLAQAFSSPAFQRLLQSVKVVHKGRVRTALDAFVDIVMRALGIKGTHQTAFGLALKLTAQLAEQSNVGEFAGARNESLADATRRIQNLPAFKKWFGDSKVVDEDGAPLVVYHGTVSDFSEFKIGAKRLTAPSGRDWTAQAFFFGSSDLASNFAQNRQAVRGGDGRVMPVFLSVKNPLDLREGTQPIVDMLRGNEEFEDISSQKAALDKMPWSIFHGEFGESLIPILESNGFDGAIIREKGDTVYVAFNPAQVKSVFNQKWDGNNPDILEAFEPTAEAEKTWNDDMAGTIQELGQIIEKGSGKPDSTIWHTIFSTAEYIFNKFPATQKMFDAALERRDTKFKIEGDILGDYVDENGKQQGFVPYMKDLKKQLPKVYKKVNDYLLQIDRTGKGYTLRHGNGYEVRDGKGDVVDYRDTKEQAYKLAQTIALKEKLDRPSLLVSEKKVEHWRVVDPKGGVSSQTFFSEKEGVDAMIVTEANALRKKGWSDKEIDPVMVFRSMTNRAFDAMVADMRKVIEAAKEAGLDEPTMTVIDESKRWALLERGKVVATFREEIDAKTAGTSRHTLKRQADKEIRKEVNISEAIAMMGDMRGTYFPRQRQRGAMIMRAEKDGDKILEKFDFYLAKQEYIDIETGEKYTRPMSNRLRKLFNKATGFMPFIDTLEKRAEELKKQGYTVIIEKDENMPESVFDAAKLIASTDAILSEAQDSAKGKGSKAALEEINKVMTAQIADIFKSRGYLSSRISRAEDYWRGFEEDMMLAGTQYARGMAAGLAKRDAAQKMVAAITGRDVSWVQWQQENPEGTFEEYDELVKSKRLDPTKQKNLHREAMGFLSEVLRNEEQVDRVLGTLKGLAVLKFLGFRISSAAVNLTNMVQAVPATIASQSNGNITSALNRVRQAATMYGRFKTGREIPDADRQIFMEIINNGWDDAQFNVENAAVLQSKVGQKWNKFNEYAMWMFGACEKANRSMTIYAAYKEVRKNTELDHDAAMAKAKHISDRAHGVYGKATLPAWARGGANPLKLTYTFQKFAHNYLLNMTEMGMKGDMKEVGYMLVSPAILAGAGASLLTPLLKALTPGDGDDQEEDLYDWAAKTFGSDAFFRHGIAGLFGINLKGSLQMNNPMPTRLSELLGAPGSIVTDLYKGAEALSKGQVSKGVEALLPTAFGSTFKAIRESGEGITTGSYSPVFYGNEPLKASGMDQAIRILTFNPSRLSGIREKQWKEKQQAARFTERRQKIYEGFKRLHIFGSGDRESLVKEVRRYNELVKATGRRDIPMITPKSVQSTVARAMRPNKTERMREMQ